MKVSPWLKLERFGGVTAKRTWALHCRWSLPYEPRPHIPCLFHIVSWMTDSKASRHSLTQTWTFALSLQTCSFPLPYISKQPCSHPAIPAGNLNIIFDILIHSSQLLTFFSPPNNFSDLPSFHLPLPQPHTKSRGRLQKDLHWFLSFCFCSQYLQTILYFISKNISIQTRFINSCSTGHLLVPCMPRGNSCSVPWFPSRQSGRPRNSCDWTECTSPPSTHMALGLLFSRYTPSRRSFSITTSGHDRLFGNVGVFRLDRVCQFLAITPLF